MTIRIASLPLLLAAMLCAACSGGIAAPQPMERVAAGSVTLQVDAAGEIRSAKATALSVPGQQWTRRQPTWLLNDGAQVESGDLIARFSPEQSELELAQILIDIQRSHLSRIGKQDELGGLQARVDIDLVDVATRLDIAHRYAAADLMQYFSRNEVLDAIDDVRYLDVRQGVLEWKRNQSAQRGLAEIAVLDAQRASHQRNAVARRAELSALELRAPHAGVLMLAPDWANEKPRVGINLMAGQVLGYLPDLAALEVELKVPQLEAQSLAAGQKVRVHLLGQPGKVIETRLSLVAATAQPRSRENPTPFLAVRAPLPPESVRSLRLGPGMRMNGRIDVLDVERGISIANIAVLEQSGRSVVYIRKGREYERREVKLGTRGVTRSQVLAGLKEGEEVLLTPHPSIIRSASGGEDL